MEDKIKRYRQLIAQILTEQAELENRVRPSDDDEETLVVFDQERDTYLLHRMGWHGVSRVWDTAIFVRIKNGKFWIEEDWTEEGVATPLLEGGVPHNDIVLAFHHPRVRPMSEFAVA